jgi:hypothetical protein
METSQTDWLIERVSGHISAAYRRALRYGYEPPMVGMRVHGDIDNEDEFRVEIKAIDLKELYALEQRYGDSARKHAADVRSEAAAAPPGYFPLIVVDDHSAPVRFHPIPDQN